jgi:putative FmdB family regulatory protein
MFYTYRCNKCEKEKEVRHSMTEEPEVICECGEKMSRIIFGGSAVHYHGMGWACKNTATAPKPEKRVAEVGIRVDHDLKQQMLEAGEKV